MLPVADDLDDSEKSFCEGKLSIITFNYDRSLEAFLHSAAQHRCGLDRDQAWQTVKKIRITHIHGILGTYPDYPYVNKSTPDELLDISKQIKIISELDAASDEFCSPEYSVAHDQLHEAERIIFLGFGFHKNNIRRFNFFKPGAIDGKSIYATFQGFAEIEYSAKIEDLSAYGFTRSNLPRISQDCTQFLRERVIL